MCTVTLFTKSVGPYKVPVMVRFEAEDFVKLNKMGKVSVRGRLLKREYFTVLVGREPAPRILTNCPKHLVVDHRNLNSLDNRISNLRVCTAKQNQQGRRGHGISSSTYKGVYFYVRKIKSSARVNQYPRWAASIYVEGKKILKYFKTELEAARQYNEWAKQYYGEFAYLNELP